MIIRTDKIWPRDGNGFVNITIGFYNPYGRYHNDILAVKNIAKEWEDAVPRLRFVWCDNCDIESCQVRIKINPDMTRSASSCIGTDAEKRDPSRRTMELKPSGKPNYDSWARTVRHEFGHMLGAKHEHQSPEFPWDFDHRIIIRRRKESLKQLQTNIFFRLRPSDKVRYSGFDEESIMLYNFKETELRQRDKKFPPRSIIGALMISEIDKGFMRMVYDSSGSYAKLNIPSNGSSALIPPPVDFFSPANNICGDPNCIPGGPTLCTKDLNRLTNICGNPECGAGGTTLCKEDLHRVIQIVRRESGNPNFRHYEAQNMYVYSADLYEDLKIWDAFLPLCDDPECGPGCTFICMQDFNILTNTCENPNCGPGGHAVCVADSERVTRQLENICGNPNCGINGTFFCLADKERIFARGV